MAPQESLQGQSNPKISLVPLVIKTLDPPNLGKDAVSARRNDGMHDGVDRAESSRKAGWSDVETDSSGGKAMRSLCCWNPRSLSSPKQMKRMHSTAKSRNCWAKLSINNTSNYNLLPRWGVDLWQTNFSCLQELFVWTLMLLLWLLYVCIRVVPFPIS